MLIDRRRMILASLSSLGLLATRGAQADPFSSGAFDRWVVINTRGGLGAQLGSPLAAPDFRKDGDLRYSPVLMKNALASGLTAVKVTIGDGTSFTETLADIDGWNRILAHTTLNFFG